MRVVLATRIHGPALAEVGIPSECCDKEDGGNSRKVVFVLLLAKDGCCFFRKEEEQVRSGWFLILVDCRATPRVKGFHQPSPPAV